MHLCLSGVRVCVNLKMGTKKTCVSERDWCMCSKVANHYKCNSFSVIRGTHTIIFLFSFLARIENSIAGEKPKYNQHGWTSATHTIICWEKLSSLWQWLRYETQNSRGTWLWTQFGSTNYLALIACIVSFEKWSEVQNKKYMSKTFLN